MYSAEKPRIIDPVAVRERAGGTYSPHRTLAVAIVARALLDARKLGIRGEDARVITDFCVNKVELIRFFLSTWCANLLVMVDVTGDEIIEEVERLWMKK